MRDYDKPFVIAEIGCNHKGEMQIAKDLIQIAAKFCKVDAVKFQKRCNRELLTEEQYNAPHPNPINSYGKTYGEHREFLEFTLDQHRQLKEWCEECGVVYSTSVWDMTSAKEITSLDPLFMKIPSASNNNYPMLQWLCDNYRGEIQISFGMTTHREEEEIVDLFTKAGRSKDLIIYACTSGYPVPYESIALKEITRLRETYGKDVKAVGFSGHHLGIYVDMAAYALGATFIERHYTLDRTWKGTDHAASLEPEGMKNLVTGLHQVYLAMDSKSEEILPIEQVQRDKLKYRSR
jgi:N-acetylneuraminate synthase